MSSRILRRASLFWTYLPVERMAATFWPSFIFHAGSEDKEEGKRHVQSSERL
jgi:hypothetical protein